MNLRNGKVLLQQDQDHQEQEKACIIITIQEKVIQPPEHLKENPTQSDKVIIKLIQDLISIFQNLKNQNLTKEENFNEKMRILSELYYLIEYYDLQSNPVFVKFSVTYKEKAREFLIDINKNLHRSSGFHLSRRDRLHARNFAKELTTIMK
jgi:hypothetical protein